MSTATIALLAFALGVLAALLWSHRQARKERASYEAAITWGEALLMDARQDARRHWENALRFRRERNDLVMQLDDTQVALDLALTEVLRLDAVIAGDTDPAPELMLSWGQS